MSKNDTCEYCHKSESRKKKYVSGYDEAWVNVEHKSLNVNVYGTMGVIYITHCPWCGREL